MDSLAAVFFFLVGSASLMAVPTGRPNQQEELHQVLRGFKTNIVDLKNDIRNHDAEIRTFESKLTNQENVFDDLRQQLTEEVQAQKDFQKAFNINVEGKIDTLDQSIKNVESM